MKKKRKNGAKNRDKFKLRGVRIRRDETQRETSYRDIECIYKPAVA